jgi:hypothetical protein
MMKYPNWLEGTPKTDCNEKIYGLLELRFFVSYRTIPAAILIAASRLFSEAFPVPARL